MAYLGKEWTEKIQAYLEDPDVDEESKQCLMKLPISLVEKDPMDEVYERILAIDRSMGWTKSLEYKVEDSPTYALWLFCEILKHQGKKTDGNWDWDDVRKIAVKEGMWTDHLDRCKTFVCESLKPVVVSEDEPVVEDGGGAAGGGGRC